jgi:hypothetical protein
MLPEDGEDVEAGAVSFRFRDGGQNNGGGPSTRQGAKLPLQVLRRSSGTRLLLPHLPGSVLGETQDSGGLG